MAAPQTAQTQAPWTNTEKTTTPLKPELGLDEKGEQNVVQQLEQVLADTYALYLKTQNAHWNVTGPMFKPLHDLFDEQYNEIFSALDVIAERIRMLGHVTPATFKEFMDRSTAREWDSPPPANTMIGDLLKDHENVIKGLRELVNRSDKTDDEGTLDMAVERLRAHEQHAWMLRVHLE